jgi:hypothetical protein
MTVYHRFESGVVIASRRGQATIAVHLPEKRITPDQADQIAADLREAAEISRIVTERSARFRTSLGPSGRAVETSGVLSAISHSRIAPR